MEKSRKIMSAEQMIEERRRLAHEGRKVVFTNGCFDILHAGHIASLAFARSQGDVLIVGLNTDASVRRNKGPGRPINNQDDRASVLAALEDVDYVVFFDEDEPKHLIEKLLPDILVKGEDWSHYVSGREAVERAGGKVVLAKIVGGRSTTNMKRKIVEIERLRRESERFVVTGGAGFIGSNLVRALNLRGSRRIIIVDHLNHPAKNLNLTRIEFEDYLDKYAFLRLVRDGKAPKVKGVFHLGACSSTLETDEKYLYENNVAYSQRLCEWCLSEGVRLVYASSAATYGDGSRGFCDSDEATPTLQPLNAYGRSKHAFDMWAMKTGALKRIAGIKYFNVYGPWEDHKGEMRSMVNKAYQQVMNTGELTLFRSHRPDYRDGEQKRDFLYVSDAVNVTLFFYDNPSVNGLFNCGTGQARTWLDLAKALFAAMNKPPAIRFIDMPEAIRDRYQYHTQADISKLRKAGYSDPFTSIEEGVSEYVRKHLSLLFGVANHNSEAKRGTENQIR